MININLKEVFSVDNPADLASKLNYNFNQLIALGVGQPGQTGAIGATGSAGPEGPIGPQGEAGTQVYSDSIVTGITLSSITYPSSVSAVVGDYYISEDSIYQKANSSTWNKVSDFYDIFNSISQVNSSTWQLGIGVSVTSKILLPVKNKSGLDRITTVGSTSGGAWATNAPNWRDSAGTTQNSQVVLFNFDAKTARNIVSGSSDLNGYSVTPSANRLGNLPGVDINEEAFPYSALLSLYSFYSASDAATEADHLTGSTGYRHQLELGSVDDLVEEQLTNTVTKKYVISPTYQNLRVRKFRISDSTIPGKSLIRADFNLHSDDSVTKPALNSRFTWTINKKIAAGATTSSPPNNRVIKFGISNSILENSSNTEAKITGALVDGIHFNFDSLQKFGFGFDPDNYTNSTKNVIMRSDSSQSIDTMIYDKIAVVVKNNTSTSTLLPSSLTANGAFTVTSTGSGAAGDMTVKSGGAGGGNLMLLAPNTAKEIILGASTSNIGINWSTSSTYALKIKNNRLNSAIPFPVSTGTLPTANSADVNVLDEYQEGTFTPDIWYSGVQTLPTVNGNTNVANLQPTIGDKTGFYTKIGNTVTIQLRFSITGWATSTSPSAISANAPNDLAAFNIGNIGNTATDPGAIGNETYQLCVHGIPNHWPVIDTMKFNVRVHANQAYQGALRAFPLTYKWGGSGAGASGTSTFYPIQPSSIYAIFATYGGITSYPQLVLRGNRTLAKEGTTGTEHQESAMNCNVTIWDFLKRTGGSTNADKTWVTISGTYITGHQTANQANGYNAGQAEVDNSYLDEILVAQ